MLIVLDIESKNIARISNRKYILLEASQKGDSDMARLVLENEAEVNAATEDGVTGLMLASQHGECSIVKLFLESKAEVNTMDECCWTALMFACEAGHYDAVRLLIDNGAEVNTADQDGWTPLMLASQNGHCDVVRLLLEREADINAGNEDSVTSLILSSQNGHCDVVRLLLGGEAEVNAATCYDKTALMLASKNGHCDVVRLLLERKADANAADKDGQTALILASEEGHCNIVRMLLQNETGVNAADQQGMTALMLASQNGHCDVVRMLLSTNSKVNAANEDGMTALILTSEKGHYDLVKLLLEGEAGVNAVDENGWTALMSASQEGYFDIVKLLLEMEADINAYDQEGVTALMLASQEGHCHIVKLLLEMKAEVNASDEEGVTALMLASEEGHCDVVKLLLKNTAEVNEGDQQGVTALMSASQSGYCDVVKLLLENEGSVNAADEEGVTALMLASEEGLCDVVKMLLKGEAYVNTANQEGVTALMLASEGGHCEVVRLLLENEADVNAVDLGWMTALMLACEEGHCDVVQLLLERKAEVNAADVEGVTALILASKEGHCDVVKLLLEREPYVNAADQQGVTALMSASKEGHSDIVRYLLENKAEVNASDRGGVTTLMLASEQGHCDVVRQLLEMEAEVNAVDQDGCTALMLASENCRCDIVRLLLAKGADVNIADCDGTTAVIQASRQGEWNTAKVLIDAGANVMHVNGDGEMAAMYITFAEISRKCDIWHTTGMSNSIENLLFQKSDYAMYGASYVLVPALVYHTSSCHFDNAFAKSTLLNELLYAFLPTIFHDYKEQNKCLFPPYQGVEGKISLHTLATAILCKVPHTALQWLTAYHRDKLVNMLRQTPLHLLAMENHILDDMEDKILHLRETVDFSFSDRDSNGRVPYHIACLCLNAQFLLCGLRLDSQVRTNMMMHDHLGKTPLAYLTYLVYSINGQSIVPSLILLSARKTLEVMSQCLNTDIAITPEIIACTGQTVSNTTVEVLGEHFEYNMDVAKLSEVTENTKNVFFDTDKIASLFKCSNRGIVSLSGKQHIIVSVIRLLQIIGMEMGNIDPLFECVPELKGSVLEYTKCGELDELDTSMKLVHFGDNFSTHIIQDGIKMSAGVAPLCGRYWTSGKIHKFFSIQFCADFWKTLLKALDTDTTRDYIKSSNIILENCKRKHGFVGMLNVSWNSGDSIQLISIDITPNIMSENLGGHTALLRPRHYDNYKIGDDFYDALELSSSQKDWDFLKFLKPEVMCAYVLVKMLRSVAKTFQTAEGKTYTAEDILPSYMVKTALLWILDPEERCYEIYKNLDIDSVFQSEHINSYKEDVRGLCQKLVHNSLALALPRQDWKMLCHIFYKCAIGTEYITVRERVWPYVVATRCNDRQEQNGINLQWMQTNVRQENEIIESDNKPVGQMSHHKISYPDISDDMARKCRVWALRILRILPHLLQYDGVTPDGEETITGVRNYYLPDQEIYARDKDLAVALCRVLETMLD